jgi:glycosyltransferase involved in cell wall biosynthesis
MDKLPLTGVVITMNEAANIQRCLGSLSFCSELLVIDSGSSDETVALAKGMGARVIHTEWPGFGPQKRFAVEQARHDWVLCLDADEWVSDSMARAIHREFGSTTPALACRFSRRNLFLGRPLRFGGGYPDIKLRLFNRQHGRWSTDLVHERVQTDAEVRLLEGDLMHDTAPNLDLAMAKWASYASLQAQGMKDQGKRGRWWHLVLNPVSRFLKQYVVQQGFRDGLPGFAMAAFSSFFCFYKYLQLMRLQDRRVGSA